jgi:cytochrome d ubiquinol oxidase subunit II
MLVMHGGAWLQLKTEGPVADRARRYASIAALATIALYALAGYLLWSQVDGYKVTSTLPLNGPSNPLLKTAALQPGAWFANYAAHAWLWAAPGSGFAGTLLALLGLALRRELLAILGSALGIAGIILSVGASMFPFILPSSLDPRASLTVWDSSSSHLTLFIMLVVTSIFIPIIVAYTSWVYKVLWGKVDADAIREDRGHAY